MTEHAHATTSTAGILERLRAQTRAQHERLDRGVRMGTDEVTRDGYGAFLRGSLAIVRPLERALEPHGALELPRGRSESLSADLAHLALVDDVASPDVRFVESRADAMGVAYVMEGSALGGQVLARRVAPALGLATEGPERAGLAYLRVHGDAPGPRWRAFLERLGAWDAEASEEDRERACRAALRTFAAYEDALARSGAWTER